MTMIFRRLKGILTGQLIPGEGSKMAIIVRADVSMGKGKTAAQCAHAAVECYRQGLASSRHQALISSWELSGQPKIVLKISNQDELLKLARNAKNAGVITAVIRDAGKTQLAPGTISVLGIGPASKADIEQLTSSLKLLS